MLATQRQPSAGDATLFGRSARKESRLVRQMIGIAPQEISLYPKLTAAENLQFFGRIYGVKESELSKRIDELLALVGLDAHRDDQVGIFSGGMKRRLNLAVSLVHRPKLILLDEPTAGVDPQSREQILKITGGLRDDGSAILYPTHYMEEAERLCDRLGILSEGKLVAVGTLDALLSGLAFAEIIEVRGLSAETDLAGIQALGGVSRVERGDGIVRLYVKRVADYSGRFRRLSVALIKTFASRLRRSASKTFSPCDRQGASRLMRTLMISLLVLLLLATPAQAASPLEGQRTEGDIEANYFGDPVISVSGRIYFTIENDQQESRLCTVAAAPKSGAPQLHELA
jgi:ABC-type multidrug transport system ATPase subunit